jgi:hypothetical protein
MAGRVRPRGYPLRRWLRLDDEQLRPRRRRSAARREPPPEANIEEMFDEYGYDWEAVRRNYAAWGCSPPPPPRRRD